MTETEQFLKTIDAETAQKITELFDSPAQFYAVVYLIAQNEHYYTLDKPDHWEQKLVTVQDIQEKVEKFLDRIGLSGAALMADIKSDYLNDFIAYRVRTFDLTDTRFLSILKTIQNLS